MAQNLLLRAAGLYSFPNHLSSVPQGALLRALNCIINRDNILESRRGFKIYGNAMSTGSANTAHQLMTYKGRLLRHFGTGAGTTLQYDSDGVGTFTSFTGTYAEVEEGLRIKGIEANSNFYFTTSDGIKKISVTSPSNLSGTVITKAGGAKALDLFTELNNTEGFFLQDSVVAYRVVWGYKDVNQNLILGTPSARSVIYNPTTPLLVSDSNSLFTNLDTSTSSGGINDANYVSVLGLAPGASAATVRTTLIALAAKLDADNIITEGAIDTASGSVTSNVASLVFNSSVATFLAPGDTIVISGLTGAGTTADFNGTRVISTVSTTTITFPLTHGDFASTADTGGVVQRLRYTLITQPAVPSDPATTAEIEAIQAYYSAIVSFLQNEPAGITTGATYNTNNATGSQTVDLTFTIPQDVTTAYFYQIYRTALTTSTGPVVLSTLDPGDECQLVFEDNPTAAQISTGYLTVNDITPDSFRGAYLYTNPNTGDGILQANEVPPLATDIATFKGYTFYTNTETKQRLNLALLSVADLIADVSTVTITDGTTTNTYTFSATENIAAKKILISTADTPAQQVDETARSIERVINRNASEIVYAFYLSGPTDVPGLLLLEARDLGQEIFYISANSDATSEEFNPDLGSPAAITSISVANPTEVTSTAHGLPTGTNIIISGSNSTPSIDGIRTITNTGINTFTVPVNVTIAGSVGGWIRFSDAVASDNEVAPNRIYYSKLNQPEAVPLLNYLEVGPKDKKILRVIALRDNLFLLKEEAVYRLSGLVAPFSVALFDSSTSLIAPDSAVVLNNLIYGFCDQGIATISDTGISIVSRPIEDKLIKLSSSEYTNFSTATFGMTYESDRTYHLWTVSDTTDEFATQYFRYNTFTSSWVEGDKTARSGIVNPSDDKAYIGPTDTNFIEQERKMFDRTDYADRQISTAIVDGNITGTSIILPSVANMNVGDVLVQTQYLTIKKLNQLLTKLDNDNLLADADYYSTLAASTGNILSNILDDLITKISVDAGRTSIVGFTPAATYTSLIFDNPLAPDMGTLEDFAILGYSGVTGSAAPGTVVTGDVGSSPTATISNFPPSTVVGGTLHLTNNAAVIQAHTDLIAAYTDLQGRTPLTTEGVTDLGGTTKTPGVYAYSSSVAITGTLTLDAEGNPDAVWIFQVGSTLTTASSSIVSVINGGNVGNVYWQVGSSATIGASSTFVGNILADTSITLSGAPSVVEGRLLAGANDSSGAVTIAVGGGTVTKTSGTTGGETTDDFEDLQTTFNDLINLLNNDVGVGYSNYLESMGTVLQETIITNIDVNENTITTQYPFPFIDGPALVYNHISCEVEWIPQHFQDVSMTKQVSESTIIFEDLSFSSATLSFASDLSPAFEPVDFIGYGNGAYGLSIYGAGPYGGSGSGVPFRTYIPREKQRCRYMNLLFDHNVAREIFSLYGISLTFSPISQRGYR